MKINLNLKSLLIGFLLAVVVFLIMGQAYSTANRSNFGFAVERSGLTLVSADDGTVFVIDPQTARADIVIYEDGPFKKQAFNLRKAIIKRESEGRNTNY